jgi:glycosyltransferase involved in cell wall biosynthesis/predicted RNA methylase
MPPVRLSILMAVYNEANSLPAVLERVVSASARYFRSEQIVAELIVVDNGSRDKSYEVVEEFARTHPSVSLRVIRLDKNAGKGAAIRMALAQAKSDFCLIQDADFEYDPVDYPRLLKPLIADEADVVLGSRFMQDQQRRPLGFWQAIVNHAISAAAGIATGLALSDVETGFKAFRTSLAQSIPLRSDHFGLDPELIVQFAKRRARFMEVPITYRGRTSEQGKKIRAWDTLDAFWTILRTWLFSAAYKDPGANILATMSRAKRFNRWMADTIAPFVRGEVLELGAGIGNLTVLLASGQYRYVATDTDHEHLCELRSRLEYRPDIDIQRFDFSLADEVTRFRQSADTVVCLNVLEHVQDDREALSNIRCSLRPGGLAIVLVPQGPELFGSIDQVLEHKRRYTKDELTEKMASAGFIVTQVIDFNRVTRPGWYLNSRVLRRKTISPTQLRLFDLFVPIWRHVDKNLPWPANSLIAIGRVDD